MNGEIPLTTKDKFGHSELKEYYFESDPEYSGAISVPVLYDTKTKKIVNNESADIIRIFNDIGKGSDLYPEALRTKIDEVNGITGTLGMHLYKTLVVKSEVEYDVNVKGVYDALGKMEAILAKTKYLAGDAITEADIRIFSWLYPEDAVSQSRLSLKWTTVETKFPNVARFGKQIYALPGIPSVLSADHINISVKGNPMFACWALLGERKFE